MNSKKSLKAKLATADRQAAIPMKSVGPIQIKGFGFETNVNVPLATFESPLWPSVERGARVSQLVGGINTTILKASMARSILLKAESASQAVECAKKIGKKLTQIEKVVKSSSSYASLIGLDTEIVGRSLFLRLQIDSAEASGHNMVTKAAEAVCNYVLKKYPELSYISLSGNFCTDKKVSAVNSILGRGRHCIAEIKIDRKICKRLLRTTPEEIVEINTRKNLEGSIIAGSLMSANAHYANILLACYLATGQDAANIVEGSQGITTAEIVDDQLYFSVNIPNIIVGTVGNGKDLDFVKDNLDALGCNLKNQKISNSNRLAQIIAATVLCSELSLLAALTNPGELIRTHEKLER